MRGVKHGESQLVASDAENTSVRVGSGNEDLTVEMDGHTAETTAVVHVNVVLELFAKVNELGRSGGKRVHDGLRGRTHEEVSSRFAVRVIPVRPHKTLKDRGGERGTRGLERIVRGLGDRLENTAHLGDGARETGGQGRAYDVEFRCATPIHKSLGQLTSFLVLSVIVLDLLSRPRNPEGNRTITEDVVHTSRLRG